jgi:hypothetical protein
MKKLGWECLESKEIFKATDGKSLYQPISGQDSPFIFAEQ